MKYTAFATMLIGLVIAGFAGIQYGSTGPTDLSTNPFAAPMGLTFGIGLAFLLISG